MSLEESNKLDGVALSEDGALVMLLIDSLDWEDEYEHLYALQNKINCYIHYCENGQYKTFTRGKEPTYAIIEIHFLYEPVETAIQFLNRVQEQIGELGIKITCQISG